MTLYQVKIWDKITSGTEGQISPGNIILLVVVLLVVVSVALFLLYRWRNSPEAKARRLRRARFNEVGSVNGLSSFEIGLLWKVARDEGLEDPLEIYFRRSLFEAKVANSSASPEQISRIRSQLYYP